MSNRLHHNAIDLTGRKFGRLTALWVAEDRRGTSLLWHCICECGNRHDVSSQCLTAGRSSSCGCISKLHGACDTPEYTTWEAMIARCSNPNSPNFHLYGGRGITVCDRWKSDFRNFLADMGQRRPGTSIDRFPDHDGNYELSNCRWATPREQTNNRRATIFVTYRGTRMSLSDAVLASGSDVKWDTAAARIKRGMSVDSALETPTRPQAKKGTSARYLSRMRRRAS